MGETYLRVEKFLRSSLTSLATLKNYQQALIFISKDDTLQLVYSNLAPATIKSKTLELPDRIKQQIDITNEPYSTSTTDDVNFLDKISENLTNQFSTVIVPLKVNAKLTGIVILSAHEANYFRVSDYPLLMAFSNQVAIIIENADISRREKKKSALVAQINLICQKLDSTMNLDELYRKVVNVIQQSFGYEHVSLYLVNSLEGTISLKSISGIYQDITPANQTLKIGQGIVGWVAQTGKTVLSNDTSADPHFYNITPEETPTQSELCVPIKIENEIIGVLNIESTAMMDFDEDDINSIEVLANRIGGTLHNSKLYQEVQANSQRLYDIVSSMGQGIITMDREFKIQWANKTFEAWGISSETIIGYHCYDIFSFDKKFCVDCPGVQTFKTGEIGRKMIQTKNGRYYVVTSAPIKDKYGMVNQVLEVFDDISNNIKIQEELENTKEQLEHSKYLAAIGELTASIAHEIRNPLNALSNAIDILQTDLQTEGDYKKLMSVAKEEADRVNNIITNYLHFARTPQLNPAKNNLQETIAETILLLKAAQKISHGIEFIIEIENDLPLFIFDRDSVKQVFWNLLMNSIEAIATSGTIKISAEKTDNFIVMKISDNGKGIAPENLKKIFEPFYSAKEKGTGLGLSIVRRIIDQHNWTINVSSEPERGTTFTIQASLEAI